MAKKRPHRHSKPKAKIYPKAQEESLEASVEAPRRPSWQRRVLQALPLMVLALLVTLISSRSGLISEWQTASIDSQMQLDMPDRESDVVIVDISQQDFEQVFSGQTRPLNPIALQRVVAAIAKGKPCVIGVDIDTSFPQFRDFSVTQEMSNVVWARETSSIPESVDEAIEALDVLGGQDAAYNDRSGIPFLIDDSQRKPRYYTRLIKTNEGHVPSFSWAVFREAKTRNCKGVKFPELKETTDRYIIGYSRGKEGAGRTKVTASDMLRFSEKPEWQNNNLIKDKIVLLGGTYLNEDQSDTPIGQMSGVEITANVIESELRGGIEPPSFLSIAALQLFDGALLLALFQILPWRRALIFSVPFIFIISLACSFVSYYSFSHWLFFAPVMVAVTLTEILDRVKDYLKKQYKSKVQESYRGRAEPTSDDA